MSNKKTAAPSIRMIENLEDEAALRLISEEFRDSVKELIRRRSPFRVIAGGSSEEGSEESDRGGSRQSETSLEHSHQDRDQIQLSRPPLPLLPSCNTVRPRLAAIGGKSPDSVEARAYWGCVTNSSSSSPADVLADEEIVVRMQKFDSAGLEALLRQHGPHVKGGIRRMFKTQFHDDDEDAVHDAALSMQRVANRLKPELNLRAYFFVTAKRVMLGKVAAVPTGFVPIPESAQVEEPHAPAVDSHQTRAVARIIASLPESEAAVLELDRGSGFTMSAKSIGHHLNMTVGTVYSLRSRTKKKLETVFGDEPGEIQ